MSDHAPDLFRPLKESDIRSTRFNRRPLMIAILIVAVVGLTAANVLASYNRKRELARSELEKAPPPPVAGWFDQVNRAMPKGEAATPNVSSPPPELDLGDSGAVAIDTEAEEARKRHRKLLEKALLSDPTKGHTIAGWSHLKDNAAPLPASNIRHARGGGRSGPSPYLDTFREAIAANDPLGRNKDPNKQDEKRAFLDGMQNDDTANVLGHRKIPSPSPYTLSAGTLLPGVLEGGINSDLPGHCRIRIRENVFDTATGRFLLIPQGTLALCEYDSFVAYGQSRVLVAVSRLIFPDSSSMDLEGQPIIDLEGYAGMHDKVNHHLVRVFGSAILMSAISAGAQIGQGSFEGGSGISGGESPREILAASLAQQLSEVSSQMIERNLNIQPTIRIRPGFRMNVHVVQDLILPSPWQPQYHAAWNQ